MSADTGRAAGLGALLRSLDRRWYETVFYLALLVHDVVLLVIAWDYRLTDKLFPYIVGVPLGVFILLRLTFIWRPDAKAWLLPSPDEDEQNDVEEMLASRTDRGETVAHPRSNVLVLAWLVALPLLIYLVGFAYALPIYVFAFVWFFTARLKWAVYVTVVFTLFSYLLFIVVLGIIPYSGILPLPDIVSAVRVRI